MTAHYTSCEQAAKEIVERIGKDIVIGLPLGLGKPVGFINALYLLAKADPSLKLTIITGLTLSRPTFHHDLEKRLAEPIIDRLLKDYQDPLYERARVEQSLPSNIQVIEFFLSPGGYLHNAYVQQHYISSSYTNVINDTIYYSINVIAQLMSHSQQDKDHYSLSSNTDLFKDVAKYLRAMQDQGKDVAIVAEVNATLPYMQGEALMKTEELTDIIDTKKYHSLFSLAHDELSAQDHLIGLYTSCLIKDDGCLQIGIGKLSNAVANALIMRHKDNEMYQQCITQLAIPEKFGATLAKWGDVSPFHTGLYASTEMVSDEYLELYNHSVLKKRVYDHAGLQRLLNKKIISETITSEIIDILLANQCIHPVLTKADVDFMQHFGILISSVRYENNQLFLPSGEAISTEITLGSVKQKIVEKCLGAKLKSGKMIHAGFFLGTDKLYSGLKNLPLDQLQQIEMTTIARTNSIMWAPELAQLQRQNGRFINSAMMVTLGGAIVSDGLKDMQEVSGVGGQFNFVHMAHQLEGALSIITCRSTRESPRGVQSNIVWEYPNMTIPRYLRDIVITEYGIADCRSKTDADVIKAILNITDSRFQPALLASAKKSGKIESSYEIPFIFRQNTSEKVQTWINHLQAHGFCKPFPFGNDLTEEEVTLEHILLRLKNMNKIQLLIILMKSIFLKEEPVLSYLQRMRLDKPKTVKEFMYKKIMMRMLYQTHAHQKKNFS